MVTIIILCAVAAVILPSFLYASYKKKKTLKRLAEEYGKPSTRTYDERDFMNISHLFNLYPIKGKETVDDVTWNDIQMPILYKHMNHSVSHIGDEYLYRHIRTQQYDDLERLERHIQYFDTHSEERIKLQYAFNKINTNVTTVTTSQKEKIGNHFVAHLKDLDLIPKISIIPSFIFIFLGIISFFLIAYFVQQEEELITILIGLAGVPCIFLGALTVVMEHLTPRIQKFIPTIRTFSACIKASRQIATLDSHIFDKAFKTILPTLKKLNREPVQMDFFLDVCVNSAAPPVIGLPAFFGIPWLVYKRIAKTIKNNAQEAMALYDCIGYIELCIGLSSYRKTLPYYCLPEFSKKMQLSFGEVYHPLLPDPVTNSKTIDPKSIITGANASGKSTFAKTLSINALTAQTINMCYAKKFSLQPACIYTTMDLSDDITQGDSF
ncbi:MAG: hypothetical protein FWG14_06760, partial [Peptococcaceae bacterium]|nr:hypothetical protein [Peptococcaceae bacterium]